jgi:predicted permease
MGLGGSLIGILLTPLGLRAFLALGPALPRIQEVDVNQAVLLAAAAAGVACAVLFGFAPALLQHKHSIHSLIQKEGRSRTGGGGRTEAILMAGEMALTVILLVTAGLLGRSLAQLRGVDPGFRPEGVATIRAQVNSSMLGDDRQAQLKAARALHREVLGRVREIPGVVAFGAIDGLPFPGVVSGTTFRVRGSGADEAVQVVARDHRASPGYFEAMGIPLLAGSLFDAETGDEASEPEILINETMARRFWPDASPLGAILHQGDGNTLRIVGIVGDVRERHLTEEPFPMVYRPLTESRGSFSIVVRTRGAPEAMVPLLRDAVRAVAPDVPIAQATTMKTLVEASTGAERFRTVLVAAFGLMATLLALVGVFGVTARSVAQRNREMGIRMALGARHRGLVRMMAMGTLRMSVVGIGLGVFGALALTRLLRVFFLEIRPWDAPTFAGAALLLGVLSVGVAVLAAFRVTRVEPMRVLREE